ncbi:MAG: hypothetical protein M3322_02685 [Actinomycetota bacterium]|nr:hypothetical protein [Actinomycetota bacterium]
MADQPPTDEELRQQLEDELRRLRVSDLLVQTIYTISSLGYRRLTPEDRDLEQARLAIEALRALVPVLEGTVRDDMIRDFNQVRANMQLAYAKVVADAGEQPDASATPAGEEESDEAGAVQEDGEPTDEE